MMERKANGNVPKLSFLHKRPHWNRSKEEFMIEVKLKMGGLKWGW
jgi:hypothetical protein